MRLISPGEPSADFLVVIILVEMRQLHPGKRVLPKVLIGNLTFVIDIGDLNIRDGLTRTKMHRIMKWFNVWPLFKTWERCISTVKTYRILVNLQHKQRQKKAFLSICQLRSSVPLSGSSLTNIS